MSTVNNSQKQTGGVIMIVGHRHPDTDSILSAICLANLKNLQGLNAVACRYGDLNPETSYLLDKFNFPAPLQIQDARSQINETELDEPNSIHAGTILRSLVDAMSTRGGEFPIFTVVDENRRLIGMVTSSTIGKVVWGDTANTINLLKNASIANIAQSIDGKIIFEPHECRHNGQVSIAALSANRLTNYNIQDRIVIMGNDTNAQVEAINKGAAVLILVWTTQVAPMVLSAARQAGCAVLLSAHGAMNTSRYLYYSIPIAAIMDSSEGLIVFNENEFVDDVREKMIQTRYRAYPIVDSENRVLGLTSRYRVLNATKRRFILVDHNERKQSIPNIDKAEIVGIVDHHRLGDLTSDMPISFRNEPVGATATIIAKMYREQGFEPDKGIASLLLAAMISDTLNFRSPTTSPEDHEIAAWLGQISGLDRDALAKEMFIESSKRTLEDLHGVLYGDMKEFDIAGGKVIISQLTMYRLNSIEAISEELQAQLNQEVKKEGADLWVMVFTSARDNGSVVYAAGEGAKYIEDIFPNNPGEKHSFQEGMVSRKNQIVPKLSLYFRNLSSWGNK